jgi:SAM-dependent methyltransferase
MTPYTAEFFADLQAQTRSSAEVVVPRVIDLTSPASVVDVGCGTGTWLAVFRENGVEDVLGIDGEYVDQSALDIPRELFLARDLGAPVAIPREFDLVLSLEVGEHLPESSAATFVETLTSLGPIVLFSAAIPGQGGTNHVNEQWPGYWAELFRVHGYVHVDCFRRKLWHDESVARWYAQNLLLYVARDALARHAALADLYDPEETKPLDLVHPTRYIDWLEYGQSR